MTDQLSMNLRRTKSPQARDKAMKDEKKSSSNVKKVKGRGVKAPLYYGAVKESQYERDGKH